MILIKLQRHADHHAHAGKRYQTLQAHAASPQACFDHMLAGGYSDYAGIAWKPGEQCFQYHSLGTGAIDGVDDTVSGLVGYACYIVDAGRRLAEAAPLSAKQQKKMKQ